MKPLVLVDFSNFCFACWFPAVAAQKQSETPEFQAQKPGVHYDARGAYLTNIEGKLGTLKRTLNEIGWEDYELFFVEDRRSKRKYDLWPTYKANRPALEYDPRPLGKGFLLQEGYKCWVHSQDNEADDAIATIVGTNGFRDILICSSDKDLWQLLDFEKDHPVKVWQLTKDKFVSPEMVEEEFGVKEPKHIPLVKALWGDSGDNVPNAVPRMQKQLLPVIRDTIRADVEDFTLALQGHKLTKRCDELLAQGMAQVDLNYKLVKLDNACPITVETQVVLGDIING